MNNNIKLQCPLHDCQLTLNNHTVYQCPSGCEYPIIENIPRFILQDNYAKSFGLQWNKFRITQLDSYTGVPVSRDRLTRLAGGSLNIFKGKKVLEAGCGAGRFTEILLEAGAKVYAIDISSAVDANYKNCKKYSDYFVGQADIQKIPFARDEFDIIVCIGVIQHTPDPEVSMTSLCSHLKTNGLLIIDHYSHEYPMSFSRKIIRSFLLKRKEQFSFNFCRIITKFLWPMHKITWRLRKKRGFNKIRKYFTKISPVVDYHSAYPQLGSRILYEWAVLDTHDTLTDYYKHFRSGEQIMAHLQKCGMQNIDIAYAGNGVEVRSIKSG